MYHGHYKNSQQHNSDNNQKSVPILDFRGPYVKLCWLGGGGGGGWVKNEWNAFRVYSVSNQAHGEHLRNKQHSVRFQLVFFNKK